MEIDVMNSKKTESDWIYLPLVLVPILVFLPVLIPGRSLYWGITSLQFIPWHWAALQDIQSGIIPLWNNLNGLGAPLAANYQSALFYPPTWLALLAGWIGGIQWLAWAHGVLVVLHLIFAGWGMKSLLSCLGLSKLPQVIGGLAFCLSGYLVARGSFLTMVQSAAWLPWVILAASNISIPVRGVIANADNKTVFKSIILLALALAGQWLSGHAQISWYTLLFTMGWLTWGAKINGGFKKLLSVLLSAGVAAILGFMISAIQLLPTIELFLQSQRAEVIDFQTAMSYSFWPWRILTILIPDFFGNPGRGNFWGYANYWENAIYMGIFPVILTIWYLIRRRKLENPDNYQRFTPLIWLLGTTIFLSFLFALGWFTPIFPWLFENIPTFGSFNGPSRWLILTIFSVVMLASYGAEEWIKGKLLSRKQTNIWITITLAIMTGAGGAWFFLPEVNKTFSTSTLWFCFFLLGYLILAKMKPENGPKNLWRIFIVGWFSLDLIWAGINLNPSIDVNIFSGEMTKSQIENTQMKERYYWDQQLETQQRFERYFKFSDIQPSLELVTLYNSYLPNINILSETAVLNNFDPFLQTRYARFLSEIRTSPFYIRERILSMASVTYVSEAKTVTQGDVGWKEIPAMNQIRLIQCADYANNSKAAMELIKESAFKDKLNNKLVIEKEHQPNNYCNSLTTAANAKIVAKEIGNGLSIQINGNPNSQWLFVARTWYPGWIATIDGNQAEIARANYLFMALEVPPGDHTVEIMYHPGVFMAGWIISIVTILFISSTLIVLWRNPSIKSKLIK